MNTSNKNTSNNNDYTYSILGENTSIQSNSRRVKDYKIPKYGIREKRLGKFFSKKHIKTYFDKAEQQ